MLRRLGIRIGVVVFGAVAAWTVVGTTNNVMTAKIVPQPAQIQTDDGELIVSAGVDIRVDDDEFTFAAEQLRVAFAKHGADADDADSATVIELARDDELSVESYTLEINERIRLRAATRAGMGHAVQTLRQLIFQFHRDDGRLVLPRLRIVDAPRFGYRGMHLDVSRHFFDVDFVKRYIDLIALHKMNYFHWHLTDDQGWRIEIKKYPKLTAIGSTRAGTVTGHSLSFGSELDGVEHGGYYTQDEIRDVVSYAAERGITIVPEFDVPGHASALLAAYPEFGCGPRPDVQTHFGIFKHVLCPKEMTFAFLDDVFGEIAALFPGPYLHFGGDEVVTDHWQSCDECRELMAREGMQGVAEIQSYFTRRIESILRAHGKRGIGWDEILADGIDPSTVVMAWRSVERGRLAAESGHDVIMSPVGHAYFDFYQSTSLDEPLAIHGLTRLRDVYAFEPEPDELAGEYRARILGGQGNLWTEYVDSAEAADRMVLPRMSALAEVLWSPKGQRSLDEFVARLGEFIPFLESQDYQVARSHLKPELSVIDTVDGGFRIAMDSEAGAIHYTLDGSLPDEESPVYSGPISVQGSATVRARTNIGDGHWYGDSRLSVEFHRAMTAKLTVGNGGEDDAKWLDARVLRDGVLASDRIFNYQEWAMFQDEAIVLRVSFDGPTEVSRVSVGIDAGQHRRLPRPRGVRIFGHNTNGEVRELYSATAETMETDQTRIVASFPVTRVTGLNIEILNAGTLWSAEKERMLPAAIVLDEIVVH